MKSCFLAPDPFSSIHQAGLITPLSLYTKVPNTSYKTDSSCACASLGDLVKMWILTHLCWDWSWPVFHSISPAGGLVLQVCGLTLSLQVIEQKSAKLPLRLPTLSSSTGWERGPVCPMRSALHGHCSPWADALSRGRPSLLRAGATGTTQHKSCCSDNQWPQT